jgi:hypothetical protein
LDTLSSLGRDLLGLPTSRMAVWSLWTLGVADQLPHVASVLVNGHRNFVEHLFLWRYVAAIFSNGWLPRESELSAAAAFDDAANIQGQFWVRCAGATAEHTKGAIAEHLVRCAAILTATPRTSVWVQGN